MNRIFCIILIVAFFSCQQKEKNIVHKNEVQNSGNKENPHLKKILINTIYDEDDYAYTDLQINYGSGKFIFDEEFNEFIIDSTLDSEIRYQTLKDYSQSQYADDESVIRISNYVFSIQKNSGFLYMALFRRVEENSWKCVDKIPLEKYSELGEYDYILGDNKLFSYSCETAKGHFCYAIVIDKINSERKYSQILKAVKFDLVKGKIIEIDLKTEKIECFPEND